MVAISPSVKGQQSTPSAEELASLYNEQLQGVATDYDAVLGSSTRIGLQLDEAPESYEPFIVLRKPTTGTVAVAGELVLRHSQIESAAAIGQRVVLSFAQSSAGGFTSHKRNVLIEHPNVEETTIDEEELDLQDYLILSMVSDALRKKRLDTEKQKETDRLQAERASRRF